MWIGRGPEGPRIAQRIAEIEELGGRVLYVRADAADPVALRGAVASAREFFGPVQGAFHAALVLHDTTLANMDEAALAEVLLPKVAGAAAFADALRDEPLDFLAFFSSAASFVDAAGQANYAAASTFEDSYALSLRRQGMPVSVVNWGYWGSVGAVSGEEYGARFAALGIGSIEPAEGLAALSRILARRIPQALVVKGDAAGLERVGVRGDGGERETLNRSRAAFAALENLARDGLRRALLPVLPDPGDPVPVARLRHDLGVGPGRRQLFDAVLHILHVSGAIRLTEGEPTVSGDAGDELTVNGGSGDEPTANGGAGGIRAADVTARFPDLQPHVRLLERCLEALPEVLSGARSPMEVLFPGGSVTLVEEVYRGQAASDYYNRLLAEEVAAAARRIREGGRVARVLEVGAGTGAGTAFVLAALADIPVEYLYTDISPAFLRHGEREFGDRFPFLSFATLDVEADPAGQGFDPEVYDVVLATNVLHATEDIGRTLGNVARLLRPGGLLLVNEVTRPSDFLTVTFGLTPGWWKFRDEGRRLPYAPLLGPAQWREAFAEAGLSTVRTRGIPGTETDELEQCVLVAEREAVKMSGSLDVPVRAYIKRVFAEVLKFRESDLDEEVTFENFGVDSLVSQNIIHRFEQDLGELPATLLFENLTITELARYLLAEHRERLATLLAPVTVRRATTVAAPAAVTRATSFAEPATAPASPSAPDTAAAPVQSEAQVQIPTQNHVESQAQVQAQVQNHVESQAQAQSQVLDPVQVERTTALDVAIVGVAGRYPGSPDLDAFWRNLAAGATA